MTNNKIAELIKETEKGCGTTQCEGHYKCRKDNLCPECESRLSAYKQCQEIMDEKIEEAMILTSKKIFDMFDKYSCIKNDKWYLDLKKELLSEEKVINKIYSPLKPKWKEKA